MKIMFLIFILSVFSCHKIADPSIIENKKNQSDTIKIISLAEKEWLKVYGKKIYNRKPFITRSKNDSIWIVEGTLPEGYDGGVPYAEVNVKTKKVENISHGK